MKRTYILLLLMAPVFAFAQKDSTVNADSAEVKKPVFSASINYQSKLHFFGRVDSMKSRGVFPVISYQLKNGLYAQGTAVFIENELTPLMYTGSTVEVGYQFPESKHFSGNVFASKFFYNDRSVLVQSALQAQTGINMTYKNKILNINVGSDLKFSDRTDVGVTLGVDHLFVKKIAGWHKAAIALMPSATLNAGTQNFTNTYIEKGNFLGVPVTRQRTEKVEKFEVLSYEFMAPVVLVKGKFNAFIIPSYVLPQHLLPGLERGENMFYVTAGFGVKL